MENKNNTDETNTVNTTGEKWYDKGDRFITRSRIVISIILLLILASNFKVVKNADNSVTIRPKNSNEKVISVNNNKTDSTVTNTPAEKKTYDKGNVSLAGNEIFFNDRFYEGYPQLASVDFISTDERWEDINAAGFKKINLTKDTREDRRLPSCDGNFSWRIPNIKNPKANLTYVVGQPKNIHQEKYTLEYSDGRSIMMTYDGTAALEGGARLSYQDIMGLYNAIKSEYSGYDTKFHYVPNSALVASIVQPDALSGAIMVFDRANINHTIEFDYSGSGLEQLKADMELVRTGLGFESTAAPIKRIPYGRSNMLVDEINLYEGATATKPRVINNNDHYMY